MSVGHPGRMLGRSWGSWRVIGPQVSMTRARAASALWKPRARLMMRRTTLLRPSARPLLIPSRIAARMPSRCLRMVLATLTNAGSRDRVERVDAVDRLRGVAVGAHALGVGRSHVHGDGLDRGGPIAAEVVEERVEGGGVLAGEAVFVEFGGYDAFADAPDGVPVDAQEPGDGGLVGLGRQVSSHVFEVAGEPRPVAGERYRLDHH